MKSRPLRVLLVCERLDIAGGVERFVCALANRLVDEGFQVAVASVSTPRVALRYPLNDAVRVLFAEDRAAAAESAVASATATTTTTGPARLWRLARAQWHIGRALARLARGDRPDVVVLNGLTTACSLLAVDRSLASRTICCDHNHVDARSTPWRLLRRWLYPGVAALVSLTAADAPAFRRLNENTRVIHNASSLLADAPGSPQTGLVLAVGRHVAQKGFDLLLQAWAIVVTPLPQALLRIVGDGPLREANEALARRLGIADRVEWMPPTPQIEAEYRAASVFVLSSRYEGMPLALLEAQALGVPSVAFDCPTGPAEIITPQTGRLVAPGDVQALAAAIVELLSAPALRQSMATAAIERSRTVFGLAEHERRWTALVREVGMRSSVPA